MYLNKIQIRLLAVGIFSFLIFLVLSGCINSPNNDDRPALVLINTIERNPDIYIDENVTIKAIVIKKSAGAYRIRENLTYSEIWVELNEGVNASIIIGEEYLFIGMIKYGSCGTSSAGIYMQVSEFELVLS